MAYPRVGIGHDIVLGLLDDIIPVPQHGHVQIAERSYSVGGRVHDQGLFVVFHWDHLNNEAEYNTVLGLFNLLGDDTSEVTVYVRNERLQWTLYNGTAYLPEAGVDFKWENFFQRNLNLYVCDLEEFS